MTDTAASDAYMPLVVGLMIAFVAGALVLVLTAEFVRRKTTGKRPDRHDDHDNAGRG